MIILALYTWIVSPMPSSSSRRILTLCTLARLTVVPSSSTGSNTAIGLIRPVLEGLHSISLKVVSRISSAHLKQKRFSGTLTLNPENLRRRYYHKALPDRRKGNRFVQLRMKIIHCLIQRFACDNPIFYGFKALTFQPFHLVFS